MLFCSALHPLMHSNDRNFNSSNLFTVVTGQFDSTLTLSLVDVFITPSLKVVQEDNIKTRLNVKI